MKKSVGQDALGPTLKELLEKADRTLDNVYIEAFPTSFSTPLNSFQSHKNRHE
jgi:hypothetical protein